MYFEKNSYHWIVLNQAAIQIRERFQICQITLTTLISVQQMLFFLRNFSHLLALLEPPRLLISEKSATNTVFYIINIKKFPPT